VSTRFEKRPAVVLLALSAITLGQLGFGSLGPAELGPNAVITSFAIGIALVKVRVILREFMEVRHAPLLLCRLTDCWVVFAGVSLLGAYFAGTALSRG
jgi:hypothetical protein